MPDKNFHAQHYDMTLELYGRLIGMEAMLRGLYTKLALEEEQPLTFLEDLRSGLGGAIAKTGRADDEVEGLLMQHAQMQIGETFAKVTQRVRDYAISSVSTTEPVKEVSKGPVKGGPRPSKPA